jgi:hypothetical protein
MVKTPHIIGALLAAVFIVGPCPPPSLAGGFQQPTYQRKTNWSFYLGPTVSWLSLGGDFDGQNVLIDRDTGDIFAIPKFDTAPGIGGVVGLRNPLESCRVDLAMEVSYQQARMNNTLAGISNTNKAVLHEIGVTAKSYFLANQSTQPFLAFGLDVPWLTVPGGNLTNNQDATFRGVGLHGGGGLSHFILPHVSLEGSIVYRYRRFTSINGDGLGSLARNSGSFEPTIAVLIHFP